MSTRVTTPAAGSAGCRAEAAGGLGWGPIGVVCGNPWVASRAGTAAGRTIGRLGVRRRALRSMPCVGLCCAGVFSYRPLSGYRGDGMDRFKRTIKRIVERPSRASPSFYNRVQQRRRVHWKAREHYGHKAALWDWETKVGARGLAQRAGVAVTDLLQGPCDVEEINLEVLPDRFVIKPNWGAGGQGVQVLSRNGDGSRYFDAASRTFLTAREVLDKSVRGGRSETSSVIVESSVAEDDTLPYDWKVFTFFGEAHLVLQVARGAGAPRHRYLSRSWKDLGSIRIRERADQTMSGPSMPDQIIAAAESVSKILPTPFVRVDVYEHAGRVVFGEVAARPGGSQHYCRRIDRLLGQAWEDAEVRLILAGERDCIP